MYNYKELIKDLSISREIDVIQKLCKDPFKFWTATNGNYCSIICVRIFAV